MNTVAIIISIILSALLCKSAMCSEVNLSAEAPSTKIAEDHLAPASNPDHGSTHSKTNLASESTKDLDTAQFFWGGLGYYGLGARYGYGYPYGGLGYYGSYPYYGYSGYYPRYWY